MGQRLVKKKYDGPRLTLRRRQLRKEQTPYEDALWELLRHRPEGQIFRRQHQLGPYIVDFYCAKRRWVIELDGSQHKTPGGRAEDEERDAWLQRLGLKVWRFDNHIPAKKILQILFPAE